MLKVEWIDGKREARSPTNPAFPDGMQIDISAGAVRFCYTVLPYPAARCGGYVIECDICHLKVALSTAGRADDPRSIKVACKGS